MVAYLKMCKPFFLIWLLEVAVGEYTSSIYHCSESNPQSQVDIEQLMGMWYGIEIINHHSDAPHELAIEEGCPVLYFSEDRTPTTYSSIFGDSYPNNYGLGYGRGYNGPSLNVYGRTDDDLYVFTTQSPIYGSEYQQYHNNPPAMREQEQGIYERSNRKQEMHTEPSRRPYRYHEQIKRIRLLWDERGVQTEYTIRYNVTRPGVWFTSGPQNGSALEAKFNAFAGTVQVLKAVGNHMVLSFCFQMPDQQLFTTLLSRVQNFSQHEIHSVHSMLQRYGYSTNSIRRVCTHNNAISPAKRKHAYFIILIIFTSLIHV